MTKEYIERGALLEILDNQGHADIDDVLSIPAADVKPVIRSKWEITEVDHGNGHKCFHCPECGEDEWRYDEPNYCPNCGAKMDGE